MYQSNVAVFQLEKKPSGDMIKAVYKWSAVFVGHMVTVNS